MNRGENKSPPLLDYATPQPQKPTECNWGERRRWLFLVCCVLVFVPLAFTGCAAVFRLVSRL
jgi:hypothetical protein